MPRKARIKPIDPNPTVPTDVPSDGSADKIVEAHCQGMLDEFVMNEKEVPEEEKSKRHTIPVHFRNEEDIKKFGELIGQYLDKNTKLITF